MKSNDWKDRLGIMYSTNPDFQYNTGDEEEEETLPKEKQLLRIALDKRNRGGKAVTLVTGFRGTTGDLEALGFEFQLSFYKNDIIEYEKDGEIVRERFLSRTMPKVKNYIETKPIDRAKYEKQKLVGLSKTKMIRKYRMDILGNYYMCSRENFSKYC